MARSRGRRTMQSVVLALALAVGVWHVVARERVADAQARAMVAAVQAQAWEMDDAAEAARDARDSADRAADEVREAADAAQGE